MGKYKLINKTTGLETICSKVTLNGFDYYFSDDKPIKNTYFIEQDTNGLRSSYTNKLYFCDIGETANFILTNDINFPFPENCKRVIATNNPNIKIPKIIDVVEILSYNWLYDDEENRPTGYPLKPTQYGFENGYNQSQSTHPNTDEDMIEFGLWILNDDDRPIITKDNTKDILQFWKSTKLETLYYGEI